MFRSNKPIRLLDADKLAVKIYADPESMGRAAADFVGKKLRTVLKRRQEANLILATGTSQFTFLNALRRDSKLDWSRITIFHLDEYVGISQSHPASFRRYLRERILDAVKPREIHFLNADAADLDSEISAYETKLQAHPLDVACLGIGENGHLAFNDPPFADFNDPRLVKTVELDELSRYQQLHEGWFNSIDQVPRQAVTLTIPAILRSRTISCVVPERRKATAVYETLYSMVNPLCPASILRKHPDATLFLEETSAEKI